MVCLKAVLSSAHPITAREIKGTQLTYHTAISHMPPYGLLSYTRITLYPKMDYELTTPFDGIDILRLRK
jgi:hypothetical protein